MQNKSDTLPITNAFIMYRSIRYISVCDTQITIQAANLRKFCASVNPRFYGRNPRFYGQIQYMWHIEM